MIPIRVDGVDYTADAVRETRTELQRLRRAATHDGELYWGIKLSDAIAYLAEYAALIEETE